MMKEKLYKLAHLISGFVVLLHGVAEIDRIHGSPAFYFIAGLLMICIAIFHHQVEKRLKSGEGVIFFIEGVVQVFIALHYFEAGKKALPYAHLFASVLYFYIGYLKLMNKKPFFIKRK